MPDKKLKQEVRQALADIKYDDWHKGIHDQIYGRLRRDTQPGLSNAAQCGICNQVLQFKAIKVELNMVGNNDT